MSAKHVMSGKDAIIAMICILVFLIGMTILVNMGGPSYQDEYSAELQRDNTLEDVARP